MFVYDDDHIGDDFLFVCIFLLLYHHNIHFIQELIGFSLFDFLQIFFFPFFEINTHIQESHISSLDSITSTTNDDDELELTYQKKNIFHRMR